MDILGSIGYWLLVALAAIWTAGVRTRLDAGAHTILGTLFLLIAAVALGVSGADKIHSLWIVPAGLVFAILMAYVAAHSPLLFAPFRVLASLFAALVRVGIPAHKIRAAHEAGPKASIDEWALRYESASRSLTFRFPLHTRLVLLAGLLFVAGMVGLALYLVITRDDIWNELIGLLGLVIFFTFTWWVWTEFSKAWFFRISLTDTNVFARMDRSTHIAFPLSQVSEFREHRLTNGSGELAGYEFLLIGPGDDMIVWSTQVTDWARLLSALHQLLPHIVPATHRLEASQMMGNVELDMWAQSLSASAYDGTDGGQSRLPFRWWDAWLAYGALALLLFPIGGLVNDFLKGLDVPDWARVLLIVPPFLFAVQFGAQRITSLLRKARSRYSR